MTTATLLTAKRGEGKGLQAAAEIQRYLNAGRMVATNMDVMPWRMTSVFNQTRCYRVPDIPTKESLDLLPLGNPGLERAPNLSHPRIRKDYRYSDDENGLLVLDECSVFLNSRTWQGDSRAGLLDWLAHSRKYGWDLLLIAQGVDQVDKQVRNSLCELYATTKNLSKVEVPLISTLTRMLFGVPVRFPAFRLFISRYGNHPGAAIADRRMYRGKDLFELYDTLQIIDPVNGQQGVSTFLTAWDKKGRHMTPLQLHGRLGILAMVVGLALGAGGTWAVHKYAPKVEEIKTVKPPVEKDTIITGIVSSGDRKQLILSTGSVVISTSSEYTPEGVIYEAAGKRYKVAP